MKDSEIVKDKKVITILELLDELNDEKKAYIVVVLHNKYGLTFNDTGELYSKQELK